ncbi:probable serine/threonine-protein phosphatase 2A regulatory subunit B'' subunit TON2 [Tanacetum coccineum]|uniref:Probable serine/threonine-protein phosphatase 2A regulatory subunit B'' subunit TON2 n=1 Tax=Tanacetum coccineum TaxID=301880 RepID=A0ABQ4X7H7_9ASTR
MLRVVAKEYTASKGGDGGAFVCLVAKGGDGGACKVKPEDGSISHKLQRLAKYHFLKKQSDLLLNADDLDAMWVCLGENCVIDDATGAEKFEKDESGGIAILPFYLYVMRTASLTQARIDMSELDKDSDGFLQYHVCVYRKACIKKVLLSNCLQELIELHQESEEEVTDTERAENCFPDICTAYMCRV